MSTRLDSIDSAEFLKAPARPSRFERIARRAVFSRLEKIETGQIVISENGRHWTFGCPSDEFPLAAHVQVRHPRFYTDVAFGGEIGAGESYIHNCWACDELTDLLRILLRNQQVIEQLDSGLASITRPLQKLFHFLRRNTRRNSRANIAAHYDLGNDFYSLWLDSQMMYSAAWFETQDASLDDAQVAKLDRICRKLDLSPDDTVVEIGTGWGGLAIHAARHYGCHVTTTTISQRQYDHAQAAIRREGLEDRITLLFEDYRDLEGQFDKLVSVEMIEAVGHEYHETFFRKCAGLLKPGGQMLLQAITIADQRYENYKNGVDFIKRYIFPGGCLTSVTDMARVMTRCTDMRMIHLEDIGPHYATTLRHWCERFLTKIDEIRALGYTKEFIRMWQFYLCYCESAFTERAIGDVQMLIMRPGARRDSIVY